jgi:hypothetical protein
MVSLPTLNHTLQTLFHETADRLAHETGAVQRRSKCTGSILARTLVFGWLQDPTASRATLCRAAALSGIRISPQGVSDRLHERTAAFMERLFAGAVQTLVAAEPAAIPLLARFAGGVWVEDTTTIRLPDALAAAWPGCGGFGRACRAAVKFGVRLTVRDGCLQGPVSAAGTVHDRTISEQFPALSPDALWLADLGYFSVHRFAALAGQGVHLLARIQAGTHLRTAAGDPSHDVGTYLVRARRQRKYLLDQPILLGARDQWSCRLIAVRVSPQQAAQRRRAIRRDAARNKVTPSASRLTLADWQCCVTSLPEDRLRIDEALVLLRARWQIELLFKLWKSGGQLDTWQSAKPEMIRCELFAKGLGLVIQHWLLLTGTWADPHRSLTKGAQLIRSRVLELAEALATRRRVLAVLSSLRAGLRLLPSMERRRKHPSTAQLLLDPALHPLAPPTAA